MKYGGASPSSILVVEARTSPHEQRAGAGRVVAPWPCSSNARTVRAVRLRYLLVRNMARVMYGDGPTRSAMCR